MLLPGWSRHQNQPSAYIKGITKPKAPKPAEEREPQMARTKLNPGTAS